MTRILYIVGNGFDIYHNIHSRYQNYCQWLSKTNKTILDEIYNTFGRCNDDWWNSFETHLADVEAIRIAFEVASKNAPNFASDFFSEKEWYKGEHAVENLLDNVYSDIIDSFAKWIANFDLSQCKSLLRLYKNDSLFLTFNYTETLEKIYYIEEQQILHIHGRVNTGEQLILGHGSTFDEISKAYSEPNDLLLEFWQENSLKGAINAIAKKKKCVEKLISDNATFFNSLIDTEYVITLGYSYSKIDNKYIEKILEVIDKSKIKWIANVFSCDDRIRLRNFIENYKISNYLIIKDLSELNAIFI